MLVKGFYSDNMVFSKDYPITLIGHYPMNTQVKVSIFQNGVCVYENSIVLTSGELHLETLQMKPGFDPIEITIISSNSEEHLTAYIGDVFIGAGQSNMAYPLRYEDARESYEAFLEKTPYIRFLRVEDTYVENGHIIRPLEPQNELKNTTGWLSGREAGLSFSALLIMFGVELFQKLNYPIGLIDVSVPGCSIEGFLPKSVIEQNVSIKSYLMKRNLYQEDIKVINNYTVSTGIYHEKVHPMIGFPITAWLWYQGEHHVGNHVDGTYYEKALRLWIKSMRSLFNMDAKVLLFYIQQNYYPQDDGFSVSRINEAIERNRDIKNGIYTVPTYDQFPKWYNQYTDDQANPIHPTNKQYIALRAVQVYLNPNQLPKIIKVEMKFNEIWVTYNHNLTHPKGQIIKGFTIAGRDKKYVVSNARIRNKNQVVLSSPYIDEPLYFTYSFQLDNHLNSLKNQYGLPLPIYRSERSLKNIHYRYYGFEYTDHNVYEEVAFDPRYSVTQEKSIWMNGTLHPVDGQSIKLNKITNRILVNTPKPNPSKPYFGVSINLSKTGYIHRFTDYRFVSMSLRKETDESIEVLGLMFKNAMNEVFGVLLNETLAIKTETIDITFDLYKLTKPDLEPVVNIQSCLKTIQQLEIVFKATHESAIELTGMYLHD